MATEESDGEVLFNGLVDEFAQRYRRGERPSVTEYTARYPDLADDIRELFPALAEIEGVKDEQRAAEEPVPPPVGQLGDYRILREVGRGGMGVVYEAEQISLGRHVALKVLPQKLLVDARTRGRFEREARAAARLHHTNIVPVFGVGEHGGLPYYVMQFIQGLGLDAVIDELRRLRPRAGADTPVRVAGHSGLAAGVARSLLAGELRVPPTAPMPPPAPGEPPAPPPGPPSDPSAPPSAIILPGQGGASSASRARRATYWHGVANIGTQVAEALEYAHKQGVLHRDIKPSNLLLDMRGTVWITDFGLAKADDQPDLTRTGDLLGTLRYMPPEAFDGQSDARGDVYSLGLTLYELLALRPAFDERDQVKLTRQVTGSEPPPLRKLNPQVPRDLVTIVHKAIDRDPGHRYATAGALAADLRRFLADEPIRARRASVAERLRRWARHHPGLAASLTVIVLLLATATAASVFAAGRFRGIAREAEEERDKERWGRYKSNIAAAASALQLNNIHAARRALDAAPEEHRNWEWRHFHSQLDGARAVLPRTGWDQRVQAVSPDGRRRLAMTDETTLHLWDVTTAEEVAVPLGPRAPIRQLLFSPDGRQLATGPDDLTIRLLSAETGQEAAVLRGHGRPVTVLAYSPDGLQLASVAEDRTVHLWDTATGRARAVLRGHEAVVLSIAFSADGRRIASGGDDRTVRLWEAATGKPLAVLCGHGAGVTFVGFSPDGTRLLTHAHSADETAFRLWDGVTGREVAVVRGHTARVTGLSFSPDSARVISGGVYPDNTVRLWEAATGRPIAVMAGHKNEIFSCSFSPDGRRIVSTSSDPTVWLWDGVTGQPVAALRGHTGEVPLAVFSPDGTRVVSASRDQTLRLWDAGTGELMAVLRGHTGPPGILGFTADGALLLSDAPDGTFRVWDVRRAEQNSALRGHAKYVYDVAFSPDGTRLASAAWDHTVRVWDVATGRQTARLEHESEIVASVAWHPDGRQLAAVSRDDKITLWDLATCTPRHVLAAPTGDWVGDVRAVFNPAGTLLAAGSRDGTVRLWDVGTGQPAGPLRGHEGRVFDVAFSPDGTRLASAGHDGTVRLWDAATRAPVAVLRGPPQSCYRIAYSWDGRLIAASMSESVRLWDAHTQREVAVLPHEAGVFGLAFSPDGTRLATACRDNVVHLWDVARGEEVCELRGHEAYVHAVAWSPDGTRLVSGSGDFTVRVWDALSVQERTGGVAGADAHQK